MAADDRLTGSLTGSARRPPRRPADADELARRLRDAHRRVRLLAVSPQVRERLTRRLLAICELAKRDLGHASGRLDALLAELAEIDADTPSARNIAPGD
jgi:hypothetical protein